MQTAESNNAVLTGRINLEPEHEQKNCSNKPEETEETEKQIRKRDMRVKLARDLWEQYQKPEISLGDKIKIATLLTKLTDHKNTKRPNKPLFN